MNNYIFEMVQNYLVEKLHTRRDFNLIVEEIYNFFKDYSKEIYNFVMKNDTYLYYTKYVYDIYSDTIKYKECIDDYDNNITLYYINVLYYYSDEDNVSELSTYYTAYDMYTYNNINKDVVLVYINLKFFKKLIDKVFFKMNISHELLHMIQNLKSNKYDAKKRQLYYTLNNKLDKVINNEKIVYDSKTLKYIVDNLLYILNKFEHGAYMQEIYTYMNEIDLNIYNDILSQNINTTEKIKYILENTDNFKFLIKHKNEYEYLKKNNKNLLVIIGYYLYINNYIYIDKKLMNVDDIILYITNGTNEKLYNNVINDVVEYIDTIFKNIYDNVYTIIYNQIIEKQQNI